MRYCDPSPPELPHDGATACIMFPVAPPAHGNSTDEASYTSRRCIVLTGFRRPARPLSEFVNALKSCVPISAPASSLCPMAIRAF